MTAYICFAKSQTQESHFFFNEYLTCVSLYNYAESNHYPAWEYQAQPTGLDDRLELLYHSQVR